MNKTAAVQRLYLYVAADQDPCLGFAEMGALIDANAQTVDVDGNLPGSDDWTPTYSVIGVYRAAAEAWTMKAGRAADRFDFTTDGQVFRRSQIVDHCEGQAARYRRKTNGAAPC